MVNKQDYINSVTQNIDMVRGDTLLFNFQLGGLGGVDPETIVFSCAESYDEDTIFTSDLTDGITQDDYDTETDIATYSVRVAPDKTHGLELGRYYYDLQATIGDDVVTLMRGRLTLLYEVT